jgi:hypothetical protein
MIIPISMFCQGRFQKLYNGALVYSTGASFIVVNVRNTNSNETKQIFCDVEKFMNSVIIEQNGQIYDPVIIKDLQSKIILKDTIYTVELAKKEALEMINFDKYQFKNAKKILSILNEELIDSLAQYVSYRDTCFKDIKFLCEYDPICKMKKDKIYEELRRRETKFFWKYYSKYGFSYFHALFLKGFSTGMDCESGSYMIEKYER